MSNSFQDPKNEVFSAGPGALDFDNLTIEDCHQIIKVLQLICKNYEKMTGVYMYANGWTEPIERFDA